jgi:hypothetical protein
MFLASYTYEPGPWTVTSAFGVDDLYDVIAAVPTALALAFNLYLPVPLIFINLIFAEPPIASRAMYGTHYWADAAMRASTEGRGANELEMGAGRNER